MKDAFGGRKAQGQVRHYGCGKLDDKPVLDQANRPDRLERLLANAKPALDRLAEHTFDRGSRKAPDDPIVAMTAALQQRGGDVVAIGAPRLSARERRAHRRSGGIEQLAGRHCQSKCTGW